MGFDKTYFPHFNSFCTDKFGADLGSSIYSEAQSILSHMISEADYKNSDYIKWHMDTNMLPSIAIYLAFKAFKETADNVKDILTTCCRYRALKTAEEIR